MLQLRAEAAAAAIVQPLSPQVRSYLMCWLC